MMCQSGQLGQMGSCRIISIMAWCFGQIRSDHYHSHWNSAPICQQSRVLGWHWSQCRNILPQPHSLLALQMGRLSYSKYCYHLPTRALFKLQHHKSSLHQTHWQLCPCILYHLVMVHLPHQKHWMLSPLGIYQLKLFKLSQHHLQAQVLWYSNQMWNPLHFHSMLWRDCWYYQW